MFWKRFKLVTAAVLVGGGFLATGMADGEPAATGRVEPALVPDPAVMAIIAGLGDNSSALLPPLKTIGEWNDITREWGMQKTGPRGRDYSNKAVWMPDRKRAFFCGANHLVPHRLNDAWEYDLVSNTWILLFAPDPDFAKGVIEIAEGEVKDGDGKVLENLKYAQTKRGGPTHYGHTWWALCYDPEMKAALWMNVGIGGPSQTYIEKQTGSKDGIYAGPPMWAFYPYEKQWRLVLSPQPYPRVGYAKQMEYVPDLGGALFMSAGNGREGTWLYNHKANAWKKMGDGLNGPANESLTCYDPDRKLIVAQSVNRTTHHYDIATHKWEKVLDPGKDSAEAPVGFDAGSQMYYDTVNKVCLLFGNREPDGVWTYSPPEKKWTRYKAQGPPVPEPKKVISYFDPARNVFVVNVGAKTWVYRYKKPG